MNDGDDGDKSQRRANGCANKGAAPAPRRERKRGTERGGGKPGRKKRALNKPGGMVYREKGPSKRGFQWRGRGEGRHREENDRCELHFGVRERKIRVTDRRGKNLDWISKDSRRYL